MRCFALLLLSASCASAQLSLQQMQPFFKGSGGVSATWYPTNATSAKLVWWLELQPINSAFTNAGGTIVPLDGDQVKVWTNLAAGFNGIVTSQGTADQSVHPTNYVSGGGGNGTSKRLQFTAATSTRLATSAWPTAGGSASTNKATFVYVANCTATTSTDNLCERSGVAPCVQYNAKSLSMYQGTAVTSANTMGAGYYVISVVMAAGASSHIDTNGVQMVAGNAGTQSFGACNVGDIDATAGYHGNICRVWIWEGVLSAPELAQAVAQCKTDFGIQ